MSKPEKFHSVIRTRSRVFSDTVGDSLTQTEHAKECDINFQIARFQGQGLSPFRPLDHTQVQDLSELSSDFMHAHQVIEDARAAFDELPERVQRRFSGSPAQFMEFMEQVGHNQVALQEAVDLGLFELRPQPTSSPAEPLRSPAGATAAPQGDAQGQGA